MTLSAHLAETAYAKINLALHVRGKRDDGYHEIETLFAFAACGDHLSAQPAAQDQLRVVGEFAPDIADPFGNIAARALTALPRSAGLAITLEKLLPVAAGLGGGSADAAAVFRLVQKVCGLPDDWRLRAARLGADVPACVESRSCIGCGTGTQLSAVVDDMAGTPLLLVNPRIEVLTGQVFASWDEIDRGPLPGGTAAAIMRKGRNDLQGPAMARYPQIGQVLDALRASGADVSRMSGSGATCFATYESAETCDEAAARLGADQPGWWQMRTSIR